MRTREKLTLEEKFALALELIKRDRSLEEIGRHYRVSHTTAYKIRKTFLDGGRQALEAERHRRPRQDLEARVAALEDRLHDAKEPHRANGDLRSRRSLGVEHEPGDVDGRTEK